MGKDPFLPGSYRGITLSSVISTLLEIILLQRLSPVLEEAGVPDFAQTAYTKAFLVLMPFLPIKKHCLLMFVTEASLSCVSMTLRRLSIQLSCPSCSNSFIILAFVEALVFHIFSKSQSEWSYIVLIQHLQRCQTGLCPISHSIPHCDGPAP